MRYIALAIALACTGCGLAPDDLGEVAFEVELPVRVQLPPDDMPAPPEAIEQPIRVALPVDFIETLREQGMKDEAKALAEQQRRIESVELLGVDYEVPGPNRFAGDVAPIHVALAAAEDLEGDAARPLGETVGVPAGQRIAARELDASDEALASAGALIERMKFVLVADTLVALPPEKAPGRLVLQLRMRLRVNTVWF